jgi:hypothetical protein
MLQDVRHHSGEFIFFYFGYQYTLQNITRVMIPTFQTLKTADGSCQAPAHGTAWCEPFPEVDMQ